MIVQRDLNSAYPWACTLLPCLLHGTWHQTSHPREGGFYIGSYRFSHPRDFSLGNLPVRSRAGSISFPRTGEGWYWNPEMEASIRGGTDAYLQGRTWEFVRECECQPFGFVPALYEKRYAVGKTSGQGMALKLALNSIYGKTAQSIGAAPYANPIWAGLITSLVRGRLIDDYVRVGRDRCVMLATDGVFYQLPDGDGFDVGGRLGQWEETHHEEGMFVIQPGLYFVSSELGKPKTRGVPQSAVTVLRPEFEAAWDGFTNDGREAMVPVPVRTFIGLRLAMARGKLGLAGQWIDGFKAVGFEWKSKRRPKELVYRDGWFTLMREGGEVTVPYTKMIGRNLVNDMERIYDEEQYEEGWE